MQGILRPHSAACLAVRLSARWHALQGLAISSISLFLLLFNYVRSLLFILVLGLLAAMRPSACAQRFETLFADHVGRSPSASLVKCRDGNYCGTTVYGGAGGKGTVFKVTPAGAYTTLVSFNSANGDSPTAELVEESDGTLYGTTEQGGANKLGTIFKVTPGGEFTTLVSFDSKNGSTPRAGLVEASDGNFYGTTSEGGPNYCGTIFKVTPGGELTTLVSFNSTNGKNPRAGLVNGADGCFYGTTYEGGSDGFGTIFKVTQDGELTTLVSFNSTSGKNPRARLVKGTDGNFYGTTEYGGTSSYGTVFKMTPEGMLTILVSFNRVNGSRPCSRLEEGNDGNFYGTTYEGGANYFGTIFKVTPAGEFTRLLSFDRFTNGCFPYGGLVKGTDDTFFGTTYDGGDGDTGTVFKVTPAGALSRLFTFNPRNGSYPHAGLVEGSDGNFYGTTTRGGVNNNGTVFRVTRGGRFTALVFFDRKNGSGPASALVEGNDRTFYGTTEYGGASGLGTVFKMTSDGVLTTLISFNGTNGSYPRAGLIKGSDGNFYGTTDGQTSGNATVFKMTPEGGLTTLASFSNVTGGRPFAGLVEGDDGSFYGTTYDGGIYSNGTVFKVTRAGAFALLCSFNGTNGSRPTGELVKGSDGNFYGATVEGGATGWGTIFKMTPDGLLTTIVSLKATDGHWLSGLVEGQDGNYYGVTELGGVNGQGNVFKMTPAGTLTVLYSFDGIITGNSSGSPIFGSDGQLYGTASQTAVWRLSVPMVPKVALTGPSALTPTSTILTGTVKANGAGATVTFEYGLTPACDISLAANPGTLAGSSEMVVSATLSGLTPRTTYFYRLTASNADGSASTAVATFATGNSPPVANDDIVIPDTNYVGAISLAVLENDSDADGDQLSITAVAQGMFGTVTTDGSTLTYTPGPSFLGRDSFGYTVSDGIASISAHVELRATAPYSRVILSQDSEVPGAGQPGSGIPFNALLKSFGIPAINSTGKLTFIARYSTQSSPSELAVFGFEPNAVKGSLVARRGQAAPGAGGALFSSFKDPLLNDAGDIAFLATLSGGDTTKANAQGIWISSLSVGGGPATQMVARAGAQAPGAPAGARWKSFTSIALASDSTGVTALENHWFLAFTGFMSPGAGGVGAANDMGLWIARPAGIVLALREGQTIQIGGIEKKLRTFAVLMPIPNAPGQGNGVTNSGSVAAKAFFTDGSQAVLRVSDSGEDDNVTFQALGLTGDPVTGTDETAAEFGIPTQSGSGAATAWLGRLSGSGNAKAVFERTMSEPELLKLLARKGDTAPGIDSATFSAFRSVAVNDAGSTLLLGKVSGKGLSSNNDEGLWWKNERSDSSFFQLLAREGGQPPGVPQAARWSAFTSVLLPEGQRYGPLFTARFAAHSHGKRGAGTISSFNAQGLWAVDSSGALRLIVQEGQELIVDSNGARKRLESFTVLSAVPGSSAQCRSYAGDGQISYRASFTDGSQAIIQAQVP